MAYSVGEGCNSAGTCKTPSAGPSPAIAIHLIKSTDGGATWNTATPLYSPQPVTANSPLCNTANPSSSYYTSHETVNLAPDASTGSWYGVHLRYCVANPSTTLYNALSSTGQFVLDKADTSPLNLPSPTEEAVFAFSDLNNITHTTSGECHDFNEPALLINGGQIYMFVQCLPNSGNKQIPYPEYFTLVASTSANWANKSTYSSVWTSIGAPFGGMTDATRFNSQAFYLTEFDVAQRWDGSLIAIITPANGSSSPETHYNCEAVPFTLPAAGSSDTYFGSGTPVVYASVIASTTGNSGCSYDQASATGLLVPPDFFRWKRHCVNCRDGLHAIAVDANSIAGRKRTASERFGPKLRGSSLETRG